MDAKLLRRCLKRSSCWRRVQRSCSLGWVVLRAPKRPLEVFGTAFERQGTTLVTTSVRNSEFVPGRANAGRSLLSSKTAFPILI